MTHPPSPTSGWAPPTGYLCPSPSPITWGPPLFWGLTPTPSGVGWSRLGCEGSASESGTGWHMAAASESLTYALFFKVRNPFPETRGPAAMKPGLGRLPRETWPEEVSFLGLDQALTTFFTMNSEVTPSISCTV